MSSLTDWETDHLENVHLLLEQARQSYLYFEEKELRSGKEVDCRPKEDWLKFRGIVYDLYSVLDYVYYLLYCHFCNKGEPDLSQKKRSFRLPLQAFWRENLGFLQTRPAEKICPGKVEFLMG